MKSTLLPARKGSFLPQIEGDKRQSAAARIRPLFINVGKVDGVNPAILMGFINDREEVPVKIDVMKASRF